MIRNKLKILAVGAVVALLAAACSAAVDETDEQAADNGEQTTEALATLPAAIRDRGYVVYCATLDNPPRGFYDAEGKLSGFEVELGEELANRLGVEVEWLQLDFDGLIATLQGGQCDAIVQELFIRPAREEIIDFIRVSNSAQSLVVQRGNVDGVAGLDDLSGKSVAVPNGTTIHTLLEEHSAELVAAGKDPITIIVLPTTPDTLHQLAVGLVDVVGTTHSAAAYYIGLDPEQFEFAGEPFATIANGIGFRKGDTELFEPFSIVFEELVNDGTYHALLKKWNLESVALR